MNKQEFIKKISNSISDLPEAEKKEILSDYEEYFSTGIDSGRSEEEIAKSLGDPITIGRQLKADYRIKSADNKLSASNIIQAVLATAGLGFFNLMFIAFPFFGIVFFLAGLVFAGIGAFAAGVVGFIASIAQLINISYFDRFEYAGIHPAAAIFMCIALVGFSILYLVGCSYLIKWFYQITINYLKLNVNIIKGRQGDK